MHCYYILRYLICHTGNSFSTWSTLSYLWLVCGMKIIHACLLCFMVQVAQKDFEGAIDRLECEFTFDVIMIK